MTAACYSPQPAEATDSIYSAADEAYGSTRGWLGSAECGVLTESSLERELGPRGLELMRLLLAAQLSTRGSLAPAGPVVGENRGSARKFRHHDVPRRPRRRPLAPRIAASLENRGDAWSVWHRGVPRRPRRRPLAPESRRPSKTVVAPGRPNTMASFED